MQLTLGKSTSRYPWLTPQFYTDMLRALLERSFESLEWGLNSPPKPHAFVSLPIQSGMCDMYADNIAHDLGLLCQYIFVQIPTKIGIISSFAE
jgi:hypothetical protein